MNTVSTEGQSGGVNIDGSSVSVGGDLVGRDKITYADAGAAEALAQWRAEMNARIEADAHLSSDEKKDVRAQVAKIEQEAAKGPHADAGRLEKLINTLAVMGPDIFEVAIATLINPLAGIGLTLKKISDKAKLEWAIKPT